MKPTILQDVQWSTVLKDELVTFWQLQKIHLFHVPSSMLKLTLPKHTLEGLNSEVSSARVPSSVQERRVQL